MNGPVPGSTQAACSCYHCGEDVPPGSDFAVELDGELRPMCCPGCRAVAQLIQGSGMGSFYTRRSAYNERPDIEHETGTQHYALYDDPEIAATFATRDESGLVDARILLGGLTCAACTWLVEQAIGELDGVDQVAVNLNQNRLDVRFDPQKISLSELFSRTEALGYRARPFQRNTHREQQAAERKSSLRALAVAGIGMMQVGMFAIALHAGDIQGIEPQYQTLLRWVALVVTTLVVLYAARGFFVTAWRHLQHGTLVMDLPVSLAIGLAYVASVWATLTGSGQVYFDSVVMFTFFLLLGRFFERRVRERSNLAWVDAEAGLPTMVRIRAADGWALQPRQKLQPEDHILVARGETIPADGRILAGRGSVDESAFNGEHLPRTVQRGDMAYAGTVNLEDALELEVRGSFVDTRLAALQRSVERAEFEKPATARLADRIAGYFIAGVLSVTALTAVAWWLLAPSQALWVALSVLVISCPCALALATPAALTGAASALRRSGVIVHGENALEALARCTHLIFDKTGTLTRGQLTLARTLILDTSDEHTVLGLAAALQTWSTHPVARAFDHIEAVSGVTDGRYLPGSGLEAQYEGTRYRLGSARFCRELAPQLGDEPDDGHYWIALCAEQHPVAWIGLHDEVRPEATDVLRAARDRGLQVQLLSGDASAQGGTLAQSLPLDVAKLNQSPQDKQHHVQALQAQGAVVAMVGDGLNDAPVLSIADVSFAVAGATDLARTQADLVITEERLDRVIDCFDHARRCRRVLIQNLCWALGYNLCGIPLAAAGLVPPWAAAIGMSASSLIVVGNSLRLGRLDKQKA